MPETLLFDVNETLLDMQALRPHFERLFGDGRVMAEWFGLMLRHSMVATVTRRYRPFDELGRDALAMTAKKHGLDLKAAAIEGVVGEMSRLPPHYLLSRHMRRWKNTSEVTICLFHPLPARGPAAAAWNFFWAMMPNAPSFS